MSLPINPLVILAGSVGFIVLAIAGARLNAFFALILAAALVSVLTAAGHPGPQRFVRAVESVMTEAGVTMSRVGFTIAMAAVIGLCLMESGAADKVIRRMVAIVGERGVPFALVAAGFLLSAPVFIDTVMMLMLPLARALSLRTGQDYLLYVLAVCGGGMISNGVVPPAPGPLLVAETLKLDLGIAILGGAAAGLPLLAAVLLLARAFNRRRTVPVRPLPGLSIESLQALAERSEAELPGLAAAIAPVAVPMLLIAGASLTTFLGPRVPPAAAEAIGFLGNKNVALFIGGVLALTGYARQKRLPWRNAGKILSTPLKTAGVIILLISAGGAYGAMIQKAGVGDAVRSLLGERTIDYVLLGWATAALMRAAQGSATVATIAAVGIVTSIAGTHGFGVHPLYILLAIGFGSKFLSWMNDPGFWLIGRLGGLTQAETLGTWTLLVSTISLLGLLEVLLLSHLFPRLPF